MHSLLLLIGKAALALLIIVGGTYLQSRMGEERDPRVATSLRWLAGAAFVGLSCSCYILFTAPRSGHGDPTRFAIPFCLGVGMAYLAGPSLVRLSRAAWGSGPKRFAALLALGIILALAALSPIFVMTREGVQ
jgi:hypothetical protein